MFIGRSNELHTLQDLYTSNQFEFIVIYGRRRVGKTALISEFINDKDAIYCMGVESNAKQNLENFSRAILEYDTGISTETIFLSFQAALEYVFERSREHRLILAIDEYPYMARASRSLASTLQLMIDRYKSTSKLMLILCGSSMSYMEDHVLSYKAPLYGRRTAQMKVLPFDFADTLKCFPAFSGEEQALVYGMVGGTPQYLLYMDEQRSITDNIKNTFLNSSSALFEEPENLLKQEVREPALYNAIITAIAAGASRMSEITTKVGEPTSVCSVYLKNLIALGLVQKEIPYGEKSSRKTIYRVADNMFRFWYRFIPENYALIMRGGSEIAYQRIEPHLSTYMGTIFEDICREYLWRLLLDGTCPVHFTNLGRWWGSNPATHLQEEIDIMGVQGKEAALFAECKWSNALVDSHILDRLKERSRLFHYPTVHLYLFAKKGFTKACINAAKKTENVRLVSYNEVLEVLQRQ